MRPPHMAYIPGTAAFPRCVRLDALSVRRFCSERYCRSIWSANQPCPRSTFLYRLLVLAVSFTLTAQVVFAQNRLSPTEQRIVTAATAETPRAIQLLETLVNINSGTMNLEGVRQMGDIMRSQLEPLGFDVKWIPMANVHRAGHLVAEHKGKGRGKRLLLIGHVDTVFEKDSPFQKYERQGDKAVGPGVNELY